MPAPLRHVRQVVADDPLATSSAKSSRTASSRPEPDWAAQTADSIERVVGGIRSKTLDPLDRIVRVVVYGLLAAVLGVTALVLLTAALVRAVDVAIPGDVWSVHLAIGGIFTLLGLFCWARRRRPSDDTA